MHRFRRLIALLVLVWTAGLLAGNGAQAQIPSTRGTRRARDGGSQSGWAIFYTKVSKREAARAFIDQLTKAGFFPGPVVPQVAPLERFYPAEPYHQNYLARHPDQPYIVFNDLPK